MSDSIDLATHVRWIRRALLGAGWAPIAVLAVHALTTKVWLIYERFPNFDIVMHLLGGVAIAFLFRRSALEAVRARAIAALDPAVLAVLVFGLTCAAAVFWEFAEFIGDRYFGQHSQLSLQDTLGDVFFGITGGTAFLLGVWLRTRSCSSGMSRKVADD